VVFGQHVKALHPDGIAPSAWNSFSTSPNDTNQSRIGYFCVEQNEQYATVARVAIDIAGLSDVVQVIVGSSSATLRQLRATIGLPRDVQLDFVFLDHYKPLYTTDLKIMEQDKLVGPGSVLVADNVIKPGNPAYLAYVRASPTIKRHALQQRRHVIDIAPELATRHERSREEESGHPKRSMNTGYEGKEQEVEEETGDPDLVYVSELLESWDPYTAERDGVEVSRIVERVA
jgi:catechol O-methyltransferase